MLMRELGVDRPEGWEKTCSFSKTNIFVVQNNIDVWRMGEKNLEALSSI